MSCCNNPSDVQTISLSMVECSKCDSSSSDCSSSSSSCSSSSSSCCSSSSSKKKKCKPQKCSFGIPCVVNNLSQLQDIDTQQTSIVYVNMKKINKTVSLQWDTFTGNTTDSGISYVYINQSIPYLPKYARRFPIVISYKGTNKTTFVEIDGSSNSKLSPIKFYLDLQGTGSGIDSNSTVKVYGSAITWISPC